MCPALSSPCRPAVAFVALAALLACAGSASAAAAPTTAQLQQQINQLKAQIKALTTPVNQLKPLIPKLKQVGALPRWAGARRGWCPAGPAGAAVQCRDCKRHRCSFWQALAAAPPHAARWFHSRPPAPGAQRPDRPGSPHQDRHRPHRNPAHRNLQPDGECRGEGPPAFAWRSHLWGGLCLQQGKA